MRVRLSEHRRVAGSSVEDLGFSPLGNSILFYHFVYLEMVSTMPFSTKNLNVKFSIFYDTLRTTYKNDYDRQLLLSTKNGCSEVC